ncbi:MAG: glycosyltransferase family 4 protein [Candidatus Omnitrophota bacterium]
MRKIKIANIGNYVPRHCGIATFTRDITESMFDTAINRNIQGAGYVVAMNDPGMTYDYPSIVTHTIRQNYQSDYLEAVKFINYSDVDICALQHEFGIYGGEDGIYILSLIRRLHKPFIATLHTVLKQPSYNQKEIIREIGKRAERIVVMSRLAVNFLVQIYGLPEEKIELIEHGVPDFSHIKSEYSRKHLNLEGKQSLMTFGLLSRDKGIDTVIHALPQIVENHPNLVYIVLGKTHPGVIRTSGEEYRNHLKLLVEKYHLRNHVYFYNQYLTNEELFNYLTAVDIYITPYLNKAQITSGTLSYAIGAGTAVVSTPYWHAEELLADGRGVLFPFHDSDALAKAINRLLDNPHELAEIKRKAYEFGKKTYWPEIGMRYLKVLADVLDNPLSVDVKKSDDSVINILALPEFNLTHIKRLTDGTGILQHALYGVPNYKEGYCLDDNARALLMCVMAYRQLKNETALRLIPKYLGFMNYIQKEDGSFRNFLTYNRQFMEENGSEDSFGRAIWALGYLVRFPPNDGFHQVAKRMLGQAYPHFARLNSVRGIAYTIIGISHYLQRFPGDEGMQEVIRMLNRQMMCRFEVEKTKNWSWFESALTYDNAILPLAMFHAYEILGDQKILEVAMESMEHLEKATFKQGFLSLIGNEKWYERGGTSSTFDQQPLDAMAMVLMSHQAYTVTCDRIYLYMMNAYFMWFLGENDMGIPLYDFETHGCCDGLEAHGVNRNQGAESTLAYLISYLTLLSTHE